MIDSASFTNLNSVTINFDAVYPIQSYDDPVVDRLESREKSYADGEWPVYSYRAGMEITVEFPILADDADDYTSKRQALIACLRYVPAARLRKSGLWTIQFSGTSEAVKTDVLIQSFSAPRDGKSPNYSECRLVMHSFTPWYVGVSSGDPYYDG